MLKVGVIGAGHLGKIHIKLLLELKEIVELVGFFDVSDSTRNEVSKQFNIKAYDSVKNLLDLVDCVDVVTPTPNHFEICKEAIEKEKHVFVEKPITQTVDEAMNLCELVQRHKVKFQVGHVERYNPAFLKAKDSIKNPMFIETHRLAQFNPRGTDVPVVLDLMIHDIDIILSVVNSPVKSIHASGVAVVSETDDITNARIVFENGCVANLTSSRISLKNMRKSRFFQRDAYISVDFLNKETEIVKMENIDGVADPFDIVLDLGNNKPKKKVTFDKSTGFESNAIKEELKEFIQSIENDSRNTVDVFAGTEALKVAYDIMKCIDKNISLIQ